MTKNDRKLKSNWSESAPFKITEWDWLKINLQLHSLETRSKILSVYFDFNENGSPIVCLFYGKTIQDLVKKQASRKGQLLYYRDWVSMEKQKINSFLETLPHLREKLSLGENVDFVIMYNYGMGVSRVCCFVYNLI